MYPFLWPFLSSHLGPLVATGDRHAGSLMAGGPHARFAMCPRCLERSERVVEGIEDDHYLCAACGARFGIDWSEGEPRTPCWPPTEEQIEEARRMRRPFDPESQG